MSKGGRPPVSSTVQAQPERALTRLQANYEEVTRQLRDERGLVLAMFQNDPALRDRAMAVTFSLLAKNSELLNRASPSSLVQAVKDAYSLGLEPLTEECAIVEYDGVAKAMPQWRGYLKRVRNSRLVQDVDVQMVRDKDEFDYWFDEKGGHFRHHPLKPQANRDTNEILDDPGGYWGGYAYAVMPSGFVELEVMTEAEINKIRDEHGRTHTTSGKPLPWATNWSEMGRKTLIRRLAKRLPGAAVDALLAADARVDDAARVSVETVGELNRQIGGVRELVLSRVGLLPANGPASAEASGKPPSGPEANDTGPVATTEAAVVLSPPDGEQPKDDPAATATPSQPETAPDPGSDPNVRAAMELAAEQERLKRFRGK